MSKWSDLKVSHKSEEAPSRKLAVSDEVAVFLQGQAEFRYNTVLCKVEYRIHTEEHWQEMSDRQANSWLVELWTSGRNKASKSMIDTIINSSFSKQYNPFKEYFEGLRHEDSTGSIKELAGTLTLEEDNEGERATLFELLRRWMIGTVACSVSDREINENIFILIGEQGDGKTRWLRSLMPKAIGETYRASLDIKVGDKDSQIKLTENLFLELDELVALRKNDIEQIKTLTSIDSINVRRPYDRYSSSYIRRASIYGCDNNEQIVQDMTGARRFFVFKVKACNYMHTVDIDACWHEAYTAWKAGERYWLDKEEISQLNERNEQFQIQGSEEGLVIKYTSHPDEEKEAQEKYWLTTTEVALRINAASHGLGMQLSNNIALKRLSNALKKHGYARKAKRVGGGSPRYRWFISVAESDSQAPNASNTPF